MIVKIFINPINYTLENLYKKDPNEFLIGVDKGAYYALKFGLKLDKVLGDFDSVTQTEFDFIKKHAIDLNRHKVRKAQTDSDLAIDVALSKNPDKIIVYGGIGTRIDHTYVNMLLLRKGPIMFKNDTTQMFMLTPGITSLSNPFDYISFFAIEEVKKLALKGFSFPLEAYDLKPDDPLCISNQGEGTVSFETGKLLVIQSNEK